MARERPPISRPELDAAGLANRRVDVGTQRRRRGIVPALLSAALGKTVVERRVRRPARDTGLFRSPAQGGRAGPRGRPDPAARRRRRGGDHHHRRGARLPPPRRSATPVAAGDDGLRRARACAPSFSTSPPTTSRRAASTSAMASRQSGRARRTTRAARRRLSTLSSWNGRYRTSKRVHWRSMRRRWTRLFGDSGPSSSTR